MSDQRDNVDLTDEQKTRLFGLGLEPIRPTNVFDEDEVRGDLLCDILRYRLPVQEHRSHTTHNRAQGLGSVLGPSVGELLRNPQSEIHELTRIKDHAKALGAKAGSDVEEDVFLAVYFMAIAAAIRSFGKRITNHSTRDLVHFLDSFAKASWVPFDLAKLLQEAGGSYRRQHEMRRNGEEQ